MRTKKELFQLLLDNIDLLETELCNLIAQLFSSSKITLQEGNILFSEIEEAYEVNMVPSWEFIWPEGKKEPRIEWLKEKIKESDER